MKNFKQFHAWMRRHRDKYHPDVRGTIKYSRFAPEVREA
jgi:hypothetical protein